MMMMMMRVGTSSNILWGGVTMNLVCECSVGTRIQYKGCGIHITVFGEIGGWGSKRPEFNIINMSPCLSDFLTRI